MLINPTLQKLNDLGLSGMAFAFGLQLEQPEYLELSFEDRLGLPVDREAQDRDNRRLQRNLKAAKLRSQACIEDLDFRWPRGLDRSNMLSLAEAHWGLRLTATFWSPARLGSARPSSLVRWLKLHSATGTASSACASPACSRTCASPAPTGACRG